MAVTLIGSNGLFTRLGKLFFAMEKIIGLQTDSPNGIKKEFEDIVSEMSAADAFMLAGLDTQILASQLAVGAPISGILRAAAQKLVIEMVNADSNKLPDRTLKTALVELIDQMENTTDDVLTNATLTSVATSKGANTGNGTIITSVTKPTSPSAGDDWQNARTERIEVLCEADAQERGTEGRETFKARGEPATGDIRHPDFPDLAVATPGAGSGAQEALRVTDPAENQKTQSGRNMLFNSAFETFTVTNTPDQWTLNVGVAGTDIKEEGTVVYRGSKCLELVGDGALKHDLSQQFNTSGASTAIIRPERKYLVFFRVSAAGTIPTGIVRLSVKDGSNNILDTSNASVLVDLSATSASGTFDLVSFTFNSPLDVPATTKFVIEATTAIGSADILYIDDLCMCEMIQVGGAGGTYMIVVPGSTAFVRGDIIHVVVTNDHACKIQKHADRLFGMHGMGIQFPIDASPTVADSLVA